jgi:hypothetical protein
MHYKKPNRTVSRRVFFIGLLALSLTHVILGVAMMIQKKYARKRYLKSL